MPVLLNKFWPHLGLLLGVILVAIVCAFFTYGLFYIEGRLLRHYSYHNDHKPAGKDHKTLDMGLISLISRTLQA